MYKLNEPVYGLVRKVIDALGRVTEYQYYAADEANLARRGQVRRVIVPGGFWRELDYSGLGWLASRTVQTANGSETTTYTYDEWGRLRGIDYPRSADVSMGWDGENRRVWVQDGVGRRDYTYDAWGRVLRQQGCCGSEAGIEVVAVSAEYDTAGRKRFEKERRSDESVVRTIEYTYDGLGRLESVGDCLEDDCTRYQRKVVYHYEQGTGRLQREEYPNGSYVQYTYYGVDNPSQVGQVWKVEHKRANSDSLLIGYEYTYDLLGRVVQSVERPGGDITVYTYTPAGRLESEVRTGQVAYRREYKYNSDGSRRYVERDDAVNGFHQEEYVYDAVSGRLASVIDRAPEPDVVNSFTWNPEGTLARWEDPTVSYARVFGYDEEGRLTRIERDYGDRVEAVYEYGYNSDGVRVWKRDVLAGQEYRYVCRIGCGGVPMRGYSRTMEATATWQSREDYLETPTVIGYQNSMGSFGHYVWVAGHWLADWGAGGGWASYQDQFGVGVGDLYFPAAVKPGPEYLGQDDGILDDGCGEGYVPVYALSLQTAQKNKKPGQKPGKPKPPTFKDCLDACAQLGQELMKRCNDQYESCLSKCAGLPELAQTACITSCFTTYTLCLMNAGNAVFGCTHACHEQFKKPFPKPPLIDEKDWKKRVDEGDSAYRGCYDDMKRKIPGLPKPLSR
ncbi:YD repeat-containing protein [Armatimonadetes bacterium GBS]|nr:YD repeat-containing protein [Armatimonadetes bacterium GBS]